MAYQLRFLKSNPIGAWLNQTTSLLEVSLYYKYEQTKWVTDFTPYQNRPLIRKALVKGLSACLVKRSLCDTHPDCDLGLRPAVENKSDDRFEEGAMNAPVKRYLLRENIDLDGMVQKIISALLEKVPEISFDDFKIKLILKEGVACHLFENPQCLHRAYCRRSLVQKMDKDFANPLSRQKSYP